FEPHAGCWMLWPERPDNWREAARPAQLAFVEVAAAITQFEPVTVGVSTPHYPTARALLPERVRVVEMAHDDAWMRDVGPTCVVDARGTVRGVDWRFNAWGGLAGGLYFPWDQDDLVARKTLEIERLDRYRAPLVNEGGAIHVDGEGTALVTEECLLSANRGIIMPLLDARTDRAAARRLKSLFPGRRVVGVPAREILLGGGNIHCITQQVPAARMTRQRPPVHAGGGRRAVRRHGS